MRLTTALLGFAGVSGTVIVVGGALIFGRLRTPEAGDGEDATPPPQRASGQP